MWNHHQNQALAYPRQGFSPGHASPQNAVVERVQAGEDGETPQQELHEDGTSVAEAGEEPMDMGNTFFNEGEGEGSMDTENTFPNQDTAGLGNNNSIMPEVDPRNEFGSAFEFGQVGNTSEPRSHVDRVPRRRFMMNPNANPFPYRTNRSRSTLLRSGVQGQDSTRRSLTPGPGSSRRRSSPNTTGPLLREIIDSHRESIEQILARRPGTSTSSNELLSPFRRSSFQFSPEEPAFPSERSLRAWRTQSSLSPQRLQENTNVSNIPPPPPPPRPLAVMPQYVMREAMGEETEVFDGRRPAHEYLQDLSLRLRGPPTRAHQPITPITPERCRAVYLPNSPPEDWREGMPEDDKYPICMGRVVERFASCSHGVCTWCLTRLKLEENWPIRCPLCRVEILTKASLTGSGGELTRWLYS